MTLAASKLELFSSCRIRRDVPSTQLTTFGVGKGISLLVEPETIDALLKVIPELDDEPLILGNGSNLVLPDDWVKRPVIRLPKTLSGPVAEDSLLFEALSIFNGEPYYAGSSLINLSRTFSQVGKRGLEFAAGIPGTLGGAIKMNAGAHGESISEVITGVVVLDKRREIRAICKEELDFSYRHSSISVDQIVLAASILLQDGDKEEIRLRRESCLNYRTQTQPLKMPSAGSVFRNPADPNKLLLAAAYYLEQVGLKGYQRGGVGYSSLHSNWLVRLEDSARTEDVASLIELGKKRVFENYGLNLTQEILLW